MFRDSKLKGFLDSGRVILSAIQIRKFFLLKLDRGFEARKFQGGLTQR